MDDPVAMKGSRTGRGKARLRAGVSLLCATLLAAGGLVAAAVPASADPISCWQSECDGQSPVGTECVSDAVVIEEVVFSTMINMKLLHSALCSSYWTKIQIDPSAGLNSRYGGVVYVPQLGGTEAMRNTGEINSTNVGAASPMVSSMYSVKACYTNVSSSFDPSPEDNRQGGSGQCTRWH
ncbi:DUF2690 domain-containing protein [Kitasatospora sp. NBC_00240]|uniref:DUF2690 domain-containing protein n=1 Tax=Kitasatospora sp. NBC_00240 TaxID=2903567 RepID=UPI0022561D2C|nr:DUF2690 domain-containing protein [Kitasatospora sp. NBC_00240]MCX5209125.1 DUF2690 domain-containing protein [Kitasatospora sp. NBC_00240]